MRSRAALSVPLALLSTACAYGFRGGPEIRSQPTGAALEARGTAFIGMGDRGDTSLLCGIPFSVSGGQRLADGASEGTFDTGSECTAVTGTFGFRAGMRVGTTLGTTSGGYVSLRGGPVLYLQEIESEKLTPNLTLEALLGIGTGGDLQGSGLFGIGITLGLDHYPRPFRVPSGRPLRNDDGLPWTGKVGLARKRAVLAGRSLTAEDRERLGLSYIGDGLDELASIASFERLAAELSAVGAPTPLVTRARRAAREEARHARGCFALASAYLGRDLRAPAVPSFRARPRWSIADIARESWFDGCLGEGAASALAWQRAASADEPLARSTLTTIAADESRHAGLAWEVLDWCTRATQVRGLPCRFPRGRDLGADLQPGVGQ